MSDDVGASTLVKTESAPLTPVEGVHTDSQNQQLEQSTKSMTVLTEPAPTLQQRLSSAGNRSEKKREAADAAQNQTLSDAVTAGIQEMINVYERQAELRDVKESAREILTTVLGNATKINESLQFALGSISDFVGKTYPLIREVLDAIHQQFKCKLLMPRERKTLLQLLCGPLLDNTVPELMNDECTFAKPSAFRPMLLKALQPVATGDEFSVPTHASRASESCRLHWLQLRQTALDWQLYAPRVHDFICSSVIAEWQREWRHVLLCPTDFAKMMLTANVPDIDALMDQHWANATLTQIRANSFTE